jgi:dTDP-4-dehydrorhamnose reductase
MDLNGSKVLVTGGSGLLGSKLVKTLSGRCKVYPTHNLNRFSSKDCCTVRLDVRNKDDVKGMINKISPDLIIHSAALINLDYCEKNREEAWKVNVEGTRNIVEASRGTGSRLVYISTDYVFDGMRGMYREDDLPNPINYYAKTKYEGEKVVQGLDDYLIARTSVLYGYHPRPNFVIWVVNELKQRHKIDIVKDQFNSPTLADDLAEMIIKLVEEDRAGIFHTAGSERISRYDFARKITAVFGLDTGLLNPVTSDELNWVARRPLDSSLDVSKISGLKKPLDTLWGLKRMMEGM